VLKFHGSRWELLPWARPCTSASDADYSDTLSATLFNSGILTNPVKGTTYDYVPASDQLLEKSSAKLRSSGKSPGCINKSSTTISLEPACSQLSVGGM
jgi:hypothetical protein